MTQPARTGRRRTFMRFPLWRGVAAVSLAAATVSAAEAQVAGSFDQLQLLVGPEDRVTVTDSTGQELTGSIASLSPASLTLLVEGSPRVFDEADVGDIRQRRPDSLKNGAIHGLSIGAILGAVAIGVAYQGEGTGAAIGMGALIYGGIGAGIGAGVDALIEGRRVIYRSSGSARRLTVAPLVSRGRRGVAVSLGF